MKTDRKETIILGAGLAGLSAAYHLAGEYDLYESSDAIGGVAGSSFIDGFTFDHAIHVLFTKDPYVSALFRKLLADNFTEQSRSSWIYSEGTYTRYPYQAHLYGLPPKTIRENIEGLIAARAQQLDRAPANFEEWIYRTFGSGIAMHFMLPFNRKVWATEPREMSYDWIADRVMQPDIEDVLRGASNPDDLEYGPNAHFWYPRYGGTLALPEAFLSKVSQPHMGKRCVEIDTARKIATFADGSEARFENLISSLPLPRLVSILKSVPRIVREAASLLRSNTVHTVNLGIAREHISDAHWIYFPEEDIPFHRASFPANFSASLVRPNTSSIMLEISESKSRPINSRTIVAGSIAALKRIGILREDDRILVCSTHTIDPAYIIYDDAHHDARDCVQEYLQSIDIHSCGRFGEWEYYNMDDTVLSGKRAAERVNHHTINRLRIRPNVA